MLSPTVIRVKLYEKTIETNNMRKDSVHSVKELPALKDTKNTVRSSNFEALRIVCMLFIIAGHLIMWHKFTSESIARIVSCGVRPLFSVAVDCFVLISGWFGIKFKFSKILSLNNTLTFWTFVLCAFALFVGLHTLVLKHDILMLVPLLTRKYWFITVYVGLCFLAPYLNLFAESLSKENFKKLLLTCTGLFVLLPTLGAFFNFESLTLDSGYGIVNFSVLYLFGRFMRLHNIPQRPAWQYFVAYVILMGACGVLQVAYSSILGFEFTTLLSYDTFFVFFGSITLFCAFARLEFTNRLVNTMATVCFAVYIIHIHPWIGGWTFENLIGLKNVTDSWFLFYLLVVPVITYLCCFILEQARLSLYKLITMILPPPINKR